MTTLHGGRRAAGCLGAMRWLAMVAAVLSAGAQGLVGQTRSASPKRESWTTPRTPDGQPELQGVWSFDTATPLERPAELGDKAFLTPEESVKYNEELQARSQNRLATGPHNVPAIWDDVDGSNGADWTKRTSLITDPGEGQLPPLTSEAEKRRAAREAAAARAGGPEDLSLADRCILGFNSGPPMIPARYNNIVQLVQSRDAVVLYTENIHTVRIVPLDRRPPLTSTIRKYSGDSRGRWEKDTLVVETTNFTRHGVGNARLRAGTDENLHLTERFTRTGLDTLLYEFIVDDPTIWTRPWSASILMRNTDKPIYEYACHEGNRALTNMLESARAAEKAAGDTANSGNPR